jgi:hypothetical protein
MIKYRLGALFTPPLGVDVEDRVGNRLVYGVVLELCGSLSALAARVGANILMERMKVTKRKREMK